MFPNRLPLPEGVLRARRMRKELLICSARRAMALRLTIAAAELLVVFMFGSAALLLDVLSSLSDIATSALLIACIAAADRPPDATHPFGHGRYEPITGLVMAVVMVILGGAMLLYQAFELVQEPFVQQPLQPWLWIVPLTAFFFLESAYWILANSAKQMKSAALTVDALHYRIDAITSLIAAVALFFAAYLPDWSFIFDRAGAASIALLMGILGLWAARSNIHELTDRTPSADYFTLVRNAALSVEQVLGTEKIRIQAYGPDALVTIDIEVNPQLTVDEAHQISQKVRVTIQQHWPSVRDVIVHIEPFYPGDHNDQK